MDELRNLAARARRGDVVAESELRSRLEGPMAHIIRRAVRVNAGAGLFRRVRCAAENAAAAEPFQPFDGIGRVARRVCDGVIGGLRGPANPLKETLRI
jgi:hypothetical protein